MSLEQIDLQDFAERYTAAWCSQNPASVAAFYSPNGSLSINGGASSVGRSAIAETARGFMMMFPDMRVRMDSILTEGDRAEYHWTLIGTNNGPGGTGRRVCISGFEAWKFGDDRLIAESRGTFDKDEFQRQVQHGVGETGAR
jgi:predicted ester cyclase